MRLRISGALLMVLFSVNNGVCQGNTPTLKDSTFVMATIRAEDDYLGKLWRLTYTEIFRRFGVKAEFRDFPPKEPVWKQMPEMLTANPEDLLNTLVSIRIS
ncbi:MAG: hypothetical protein HC887_12250 [Desulfobacteraceae bacterium]|nr:hypothetical protein [Desulfobacteraceae bacterium]